jgi:hypothetical protein
MSIFKSQTQKLELSERRHSFLLLLDSSQKSQNLRVDPQKVWVRDKFGSLTILVLMISILRLV